MSAPQTSGPERRVQTEGRLDAQGIGTPERSHLQVAFRAFLHHRPAMISTVGFALILIFAFVLPLVWPYDYTVNRREVPPGLPWFEDWGHPMGTSQLSHDLTAQLMRGARNSLLVGLLAACVGTTLGTVVGLVAGYYRGWIESALMRLVDVIIVVPFLVVVLVVAGSVNASNWWNVGLLIGVFAWTVESRVIRGQVLSLREREYVEAARAMGASDFWIITRHLFPNVFSTVLVIFTLAVANAIIAEAVLAFLGFGIQPPDISLGFMIEDARTAVRTRPWLFYPPGILIVLIILAINFIGDGLRDSLDPNRRKVRR